MRFKDWFLWRIVVVITLFLLSYPCIKASAIAFPDPSKITGMVGFDAEEITISTDKGLVEATGGVKVRYAGRELSAGKLRYFYKKGIIEISDDVSFIDEDTEFHFSRFVVNMTTRQSVFHDGFVYVKNEHLIISAERFEEISEKKFRLFKAKFTTCDECEVPDWRLKIRRGTLTLGGYATGENIVVEIKEKPVFWLPYAFFPAKVERETGFLFPRFSSGNTTGFRLILPFYIVTSKSTDLTFTSDYMQKRGFMPHMEFRYSLTPETRGLLYGAFIDDKETEEKRYRIKYDAAVTGNFPFYATADIDYVNEKNFYADFVDDVYLRTARQVFSVASSGYEGDKGYGEIYGVYTQDLTMLIDDKKIEQISPAFIAALKKTGALNFMITRGETSLKNFYSKADGGTYKGTIGFEGDIPINFGDLFIGDIYFNVSNGIYYYKNTFDEWNFDNFIYFDNAYTLQTQLKKEYGWGKGEIIHVVKPFVKLHLTNRIQGNSPRNFEPVDKAPEKLRLLLGFDNYILNHVSEGLVEETGSFSIKYAYDLKRDVDPTNALLDPYSEYFRVLQDQIDIAVDGIPSEDSSSDIYLDGYLKPGKFTRFFIEGFFSTKGKILDKLSLGFNYDNRENTLASLIIRHTRRLATDLNGALNYRLLKWLNVRGSLDYSLKDWEIEESTTFFDYIPRSQCWTFSLGISRRIRPLETSYLFSVSLRGLGQIGR